MRNVRSRRWPAWAPAVLALASALVSLYWTAGGTALLDTVGGAIEDLARERSPGWLALGGGTVLVKAIAGALALALAVARPRASAVRRRVLLLANGAASAILCLWGGAKRRRRRARPQRRHHAGDRCRPARPALARVRLGPLVPRLGRRPRARRRPRAAGAAGSGEALKPADDVGPRRAVDV